MEPFKVIVLGCGSALPTLKHFASSQIVEIRGKQMMVDCGEGTQISMRRNHIGFSRLQSVFITHLHGDHCFGLIGMISSFGMTGRTAPLHVYAPEAFEPLLKAQLELFCKGLDFEVVFHAVDTTVQQTVYEDRSMSVETIPLDHRVPCAGYLFREKSGQRHICRDMIDCYEIPISQIGNIKAGADWHTEDGRVIPNEMLTTPPDPVRSYAYCSDTRYIPTLHNIVAGVDLLYHEATYDSTLEDRARLYAHSTARQAAMVARDAHAKRLMLGHFSKRYDDESVLLDEAKAVFPNTILANEGLVVNI